MKNQICAKCGLKEEVHQLDRDDNSPWIDKETCEKFEPEKTDLRTEIRKLYGFIPEIETQLDNIENQGCGKTDGYYTNKVYKECGVNWICPECQNQGCGKDIHNTCGDFGFLCGDCHPQGCGKTDGYNKVYKECGVNWICPECQNQGCGDVCECDCHAFVGGSGKPCPECQNHSPQKKKNSSNFFSVISEDTPSIRNPPRDRHRDEVEGTDTLSDNIDKWWREVMQISSTSTRKEELDYIIKKSIKKLNEQLKDFGYDVIDLLKLEKVDEYVIEKMARLFREHKKEIDKLAGEELI